MGVGGRVWCQCTCNHQFYGENIKESIKSHKLTKFTLK